MQRNSVNKKVKKKPFIVSLIGDSDFQKIQIIINACTFRENTMPIWCAKDSYIKFKVKGKWRIDKLYPYTNSRGLPSNNNGGFGYGALIGRIGNGDKFVVTDDKAVVVKEEGPLYLKQLLPKNMKLEPEGKLEVNVYDGEFMEIEEINQRIGWIENNSIINDETNDNNLTRKQKEKKEKKEFEKKLKSELNNLRMNPLIFYEQNIIKSKNNNSNKTKKYLELLNNSNLSALNQIDDYYNSILSYFKLFEQDSNKRNLNKNNIINFIRGLEGEIEYYLMDKFGTNVKVKCKLTQKTNPKDIIIQCFFDKQYRFYIFNKKSQDLTINTFNKYYGDYTLIIMAFTFGNTNSEVLENNN